MRLRERERQFKSQVGTPWSTIECNKPYILLYIGLYWLRLEYIYIYQYINIFISHVLFLSLLLYYYYDIIDDYSLNSIQARACVSKCVYRNSLSLSLSVFSLYSSYSLFLTILIIPYYTRYSSSYSEVGITYGICDSQ